MKEWQGTCGLWEQAARRRSRRARWLGAGAVLLGWVVAIVGGVQSGGAGTWWPTVAVGAVLAGAGLAMSIQGRELWVRTARGTALWIEVESFRRFLAQAGVPTVEMVDAEQVERYTAWAVALGELANWSKAVEASTVSPSMRGRTRIRHRYYGPALATTLVASTVNVANPPSSSSSSSGSSSGGGSVGGGEGGGGGGSW